MKKLLLLLFALSPTAFGQLGDIEQQYIEQTSVIANPGFENGISRWEVTGAGTLITVSDAPSVYLGAVSGQWDASATGEFLRSRLADGVIPQGLAGQPCEASVHYLWEFGTTGHIIFRVTDGTTALSSDVTLVGPVANGFTKATAYFDCPVLGTTIRAEFETTANPNAILVDGFHVGNRLGTNTNVLPVVYTETDTFTNFGATGTITHSKAIPVADQNWIVVVEQDGAEDIILDNGWITDLNPDSVDYDYTGLAGADVITVKLQDTRENSEYVANLGVNFTYGPSDTAPAASIAHGLSNVPRSIIVQHEGPTGEWVHLEDGSYCKVTSLNVNCDFTGLTIDATHKIFIGVSTSINPSFLDGDLDLNNLVVNDTLGVGTSAQAYPLHVQTGSSGATANVNADDSVIEGSGNTGLTILAPDASNAAIRLGSPGDNGGGILSWNYDGGNLNLETSKATGTMNLRTGNGAQAVHIDDEQNVGIGTTTPFGTTGRGSLTLSGAAPGGQLYFQNTSAPANARVMRTQHDSSGALIFAGRNDTDTGDGNAPNLLHMDMVNERIGINVDPIYALDVDHDGASGVARFRNSGGNDAYFILASSGGQEWRVESSNDDVFRIREGTATRFAIGSSNAVQLYMQAQESTDLCASGGTGAMRDVGPCVPSSKRFKENISEITEEDASKVYEAVPVKFKYTEEAGGAWSYGVIAEDMDKLLPILTEYSDGEIRSFNYKHYTGVLTKVIQMQKKEITAMQSWICSQDSEAPFCEGVN